MLPPLPLGFHGEISFVVGPSPSSIGDSGGRCTAKPLSSTAFAFYPMSLKLPPGTSTGRTVSLTWVIVLLLVVGGGAVAVSSVAFSPKSTTPQHSIQLTD